MWRVGESSAVTSRCRATVARSSCAIRSPPRDPHISSSTFRLRRIVDEPGGPQLPRFARCCYHPWTPTSPPRRSACGGSSTSQGVRSCLASLVAATTPGPPSVHRRTGLKPGWRIQSEQPLQDAPYHWSRGGGAVAALFHHADHHVLRVIGRSDCREP